jgi:hypothetical protein
VEWRYEEGSARTGSPGLTAGRDVRIGTGWIDRWKNRQTSFCHTQHKQPPHSTEFPMSFSSFGQPLTSRESEAAYLEKLNEGIAKGTSWERVTEMIQLENSRKFSGGHEPTPSTPLSSHTSHLIRPISHTSPLTLALELQAPSARSQSADGQNPKPSDPLFPADQTWQE